MAYIVFSGGETLECPGADAHGLMRNLSRIADGSVASEHGVALPPGFVDVHTERGVRYVNPAQVAYVCDEAPATLTDVFSEQLAS